MKVNLNQNIYFHPFFKSKQLNYKYNHLLNWPIIITHPPPRPTLIIGDSLSPLVTRPNRMAIATNNTGPSKQVCPENPCRTPLHCASDRRPCRIAVAVPLWLHRVDRSNTIFKYNYIILTHEIRTEWTTILGFSDPSSTTFHWGSTASY